MTRCRSSGLVTTMVWPLSFASIAKRLGVQRDSSRVVARIVPCPVMGVAGAAVVGLPALQRAGRIDVQPMQRGIAAHGHEEAVRVA